MNLLIIFGLFVGLAQYFPALSAEPRSWQGAKFLGAVFLLPVLLFLGNVVLLIPLTILAWAIALVAVLGGLRGVWVILRSPERGVAVRAISHPVWALTILAGVVLLFRGDLGYQPLSQEYIIPAVSSMMVTASGMSAGKQRIGRPAAASSSTL